MKAESNSVHTEQDAILKEGECTVPPRRRSSKEYPKEKAYAIIRLDMGKFHKAEFGDISMSMDDFPIRDSFVSVVNAAEELPKILEDSLTMSNRLEDDEEPPVYFVQKQWALSDDEADDEDDDDDEKSYENLNDEVFRKPEPSPLEGSHDSLYLRRNSGDLSEYEVESLDDDADI